MKVFSVVCLGLLVGSISLQGEDKRRKLLSPAAQTLVQKLDSWEAERKAAYEEEVKGKRKQVAVLLEQHLKTATQKGRLDEAIYLRSLIADFRGMAPQPETSFRMNLENLACRSVGTSAGEVGLTVELDGKSLYENKKQRGFHVVAIQGTRVLSTAIFELGYDPEALDKLDKHLRSLPNGVMVVGGVVDTAEGDLRKALQRIGGVPNGIVGRRQSYLVIGMKGSKQDDAIEVGPFDTEFAIFPEPEAK